MSDSWAEESLEDLLREVDLNPFQEERIAADLRQQASDLGTAMLRGGHVPESPWPTLRQLTANHRCQLVADLREAQQRLREANERAAAAGKPNDRQPGAFRERPIRWPGPARGEVQKLVQGIVALDYRLALITRFEAGGD